MPLRDYQIRAVTRMRDGRAAARAKGRPARILLVSPTGSGKTEMYLDRARAAANIGLRVGIFAHRRELIDQPARRLDLTGTPYGVIMAADKRSNPSAPIQILSIDTVIARSWAPDLDVLIIDEAHRAAAERYRTLFAAYPNADVFGFTATPERGDGAPMGDAFDEMIVVATVAELQALWTKTGGREGLVPVEHIGPKGGKKLTAAEGMAEAPEVMYLRLCRERRRTLPAIFFFENTGPAHDFARLLGTYGVRAASLDGKTPKLERKSILDRYQAGELDVLVNCDVLTEGTDLPRTEVVCIARGCSTWGTWVQMGGRGLRPFPGKSRCFILDPYGHTYEHGLLSDAPEFSLSGRAATLGALKSSIRTCRACGGAFRSASVICPQCGAHVPLPEPPKVKAKPASTGAIAAGSVVDHRARFEEFERLVYIAVLNGHKRGAAGKAFERQFNCWPPYRMATWDAAETKAKERIRADNQKAS